MRLLITGGCGFIGVNLTAFLLAQGHGVRILDNEVLGKRGNLAEFDGVEFIHGDIRDEKALDVALDQVDCVVHLAADTRVMDSIAAPAFNFDVNVAGTFALLLAMRRHGVTRMINASTGGAILGEAQPPVHEDMLPRPASPYGASKLAVEGYLSAFSQSYGFKAASLRFSNVYGPRSWHKGSVVAHFLKEILKGKPLTVYGDGSQIRDYVHVEDICRGIMLAIEKEVSGVFQLGTGIPVTINELLDLIRGTVGQGFAVDVRYEDFRPGEIRNTWCDIARASSVLGYSPSISLKEGLAGTWRWFTENWGKDRHGPGGQAR